MEETHGEFPKAVFTPMDLDSRSEWTKLLLAE